MKKIIKIISPHQKELINYSIRQVRNNIERSSSDQLCIVSAIFGGSDYSDTLRHTFLNVNEDIFIFTDEENLFENFIKYNNFKIIYIPKNLLLDNPRLTAKTFKVLLPIIFCRFFKSGIWIDANVEIKNFNSFFPVIKQESADTNFIVGFQHIKSRNIIQEILYILFFRKDNFRNLLKALIKLSTYAFRKNKIYILFKPIYWGGFLYYRNFNKKSSLLWWYFINNSSIRDQLSLPIIFNINSSTRLKLSRFDSPPSPVKHKKYIHYSVDKSSILFNKLQMVLYKTYTKLRKFKTSLFK